MSTPKKRFITAPCILEVPDCQECIYSERFPCENCAIKHGGKFGPGFGCCACDEDNHVRIFPKLEKISSEVKKMMLLWMWRFPREPVHIRISVLQREELLQVKAIEEEEEDGYGMMKPNGEFTLILDL